MFTWGHGNLTVTWPGFSVWTITAGASETPWGGARLWVRGQDIIAVASWPPDHLTTRSDDWLTDFYYDLMIIIIFFQGTVPIIWENFLIYSKPNPKKRFFVKWCKLCSDWLITSRIYLPSHITGWQLDLQMGRMWDLKTSCHLSGLRFTFPCRFKIFIDIMPESLGLQVVFCLL